MALKDRAKEFAKSIIETKEYMDFKQFKTKIDQNKALKSEVDRFLKLQSEVISKGKSAKDSEIAGLNKKYQLLTEYPEFGGYLKASKQYNDMVAIHFNMIYDIIEADLNSR